MKRNGKLSMSLSVYGFCTYFMTHFFWTLAMSSKVKGITEQADKLKAAKPYLIGDCITMTITLLACVAGVYFGTKKFANKNRHSKTGLIVGSIGAAWILLTIVGHLGVIAQI